MPAELEAAGRLEWGRMLRQAALPPTTVYAALMLATCADKNGTNAHPGEDRLAAVTGYTTRAIRKHLGELRDVYALIDRTDRGSAYGRKKLADGYRLVL